MISRNNPETTDISGNLFPYAYLAESLLKKALSFFDAITVFQPWFMERPPSIPNDEDFHGIRILNPPGHLKPGEGFKTLLSEYHHWIQNNQDKGYTAFINSSQGIEVTEDTSWEIRRMLRQAGKNASIPEGDHALRWHLILHLAQEVEDQRLEADRLLETLREKSPPLEGIVENGEDMETLLRDLPHFGSEPMVGEYHLRQIIEAWFSLFKEYLNGHEILVTFNRQIMDYATGLWNEFGVEGETNPIQKYQFTFPDLSCNALDDLINIKKKYMSDGKIKEFKNFILEPENHPVSDGSALHRLSKEVGSSFPQELSRGRLNIVVTHFPALSGLVPLEMNGLLKQFNKKIIFLMEDDRSYE